MLAIRNEPLYKNKLMISSLAVLSGFVMTVGIIRAVTPADPTNQQATQTSERRSSSLIPISASESERASESGSSPASDQSSDQAASSASQSNPLMAPSAQTSSSQSSTSQQPAPTSPSQAQAANQPASGSNQGTGSNGTNPTPPQDNKCTIDTLLGPLMGTLINGVCVN